MTRSTVPSLAARAALALAAVLTLAGTARAQDMPDGSDLARRAVHVCAACHGEGGRSTTGAYPSLAGQPAQYTARQLMDFRAQQRAETDSKAYMWGVSALLDDATIQSLAGYYAAQTPPAGRSKAPPAVLRTGQRLFEEGMPARGVRACASCHGDKAEGAAGFPRLAGQHAGYLLRQMQVFSTSLRPHGVLMKAEVAGLTPGQMRAVAAYLQSL
ncbi:c-type cytochrome [Sphaerotilus microaerophilus]|uniref:c-type cytochrome n=1 Tax=Sphaerotilus microaerophilus TaxID=2914710 RepID=UPI002073B1A6|nr:c-type cytochrome [Sphaerotilus sp. FB-5]